MWEILCDGLMKPRLNFLAIILKGMFGAKTTLRITKGTPYPQWSMVWQHHAFGLFFFSWNWGRSVHSKRVTLPSEGHFRVKTIMAAILKCPSKPKCSKLATSKGPSKWRISNGYNWCTLRAPMILCTDSLHDDGAFVWWLRRTLQETVVWSPTTFNPSKLSLQRVNPLKGLEHRDKPCWMECRAGLVKVEGIMNSSKYHSILAQNL